MRFATLFSLVLLAVALAACGERPPRADPERGPAYNAEPGSSPMRDRTVKQGESR